MHMCELCGPGRKGQRRPRLDCKPRGGGDRGYLRKTPNWLQVYIRQNRQAVLARKGTPFNYPKLRYQNKTTSRLNAGSTWRWDGTQVLSRDCNITFEKKSLDLMDEGRNQAPEKNKKERPHSFENTINEVDFRTPYIKSLLSLSQLSHPTTNARAHGGATLRNKCLPKTLSKPAKRDER